MHLASILLCQIYWLLYFRTPLCLKEEVKSLERIKFFGNEMPHTINKAFNIGWESVGLDLVQRKVYISIQPDFIMFICKNFHLSPFLYLARKTHNFPSN